MENIDQLLKSLEIGDIVYEKMGTHSIARVPGGWIFTFIAISQYTDAAPCISSVFVPIPNINNK